MTAITVEIPDEAVEILRDIASVSKCPGLPELFAKEMIGIAKENAKSYGFHPVTLQRERPEFEKGVDEDE